MALVPSGIAVWLSTVAVGMVLRVVAGQGTAVSFIIVALCFLGLFLLGWRLLARTFSRPTPQTPRRADDPSAVAAVHRGDRPAEGAGRGERLEHP
jgi:membrane protein implicated in regulation of membrane protease activity